MRFGGHETFAIREGWLHRGLKLLIEEPGQLVDQYSADWLGVGRNMAKSIRYWLAATGLAEASVLHTGAAFLPPNPTELGRLVWERDRYFSHIDTLWALHANLIHNSQHASAWGWFFNNFAMPRFDRSLCVDRLSRHLRLTQARLPSPKTLQREVAVLLQTYARPVPPKPSDPEDAQDCPFQELGLLSYFTDSGSYRFRDDVRRDISFEAFGYAISRAFPGAAGGSHVEFSLHDATVEPSSPGRIFVLSSEALFDLISRYELTHPGTLSIRALAGERLMRMPVRTPREWLRQAYDSTNVEAQGAA